GGQRNTYTYDQSPPTPGAENIGIYTDWNGMADNNWDNPGNWHNGVPNDMLNAEIPDVSGLKASFPVITGLATCNNLFIYAGASLEIGTTGALTVNGTLTNNGTLTVKSDATGTGSLIESSGVNATVERYYTGSQWHFISSPISGATANMFLGLYLQYHTESTNQYTDITDPLTALNVMQGYALWNNINAKAQFIGTLNTGSYGSANNLTRSGTPPPPEDTLGWNLMGNPYPSSIDWNASPGWTKTNVNATIYIEASGNWATWNGTAGTNGGTQYIAPGQGYFVEVTANQSLGTLICDNSVKIHNPTTFFKNTVNNMVRFLAEGNGKTDETVILFDEDATEEFDGNYDAHKFFAYDVSYPQIYSIADKNIAINTLPETEWVQLGFKAGISGEYTISATEINDISSVWLEDTFTGGKPIPKKTTDITIISFIEF
ncbi:MAG: hypothetical protein K8R77_11985, partial [Anaerolineaceae bacterium]|nr:hypothetical protein [Anaerolineaceae bacterium]